MFAAIRDIFLKGGSISDAIAYVFKSTGNMPTKSEGMKMIKMYQNIQKETAKIIEFPKDRITPFHKPRPGDVKKIDEDPTSAMYDRHIKEIEGIDKGQGMGFYREMGDIMKKHRREELELQYDTMYNKIF